MTWVLLLAVAVLLAAREARLFDRVTHSSDELAERQRRVRIESDR